MRTDRKILPALLALGIGVWVLTGRAAAAKRSSPATKPARPPSGLWKQAAVLQVKQPCHLLEFAADGKTLASVSAGGINNLGQVLPGEITLWDVAKRKARAAFKGHQGTITGLAFSTDSKTLISLGSEGILKHWDVSLGKVRSSVRLTLSGFVTVAFSPDRKTMATAVGNLQPQLAQLGGQVQLWNVTTGRKLGTIPAHDTFLTRLFFSPTGKTLVTFGMALNKNAQVAADGTSDFFVGETKFWDPVTRRPKPIRATGGSTCAFSPDGAVLVTDMYDKASRDVKIKFVNLTRKTVRATRTGHRTAINGLACTRDGKILASAGFDQIVKLWDMATAKELAVLKGHRGWVSALAFAPDGNTLVSAGGDSTLRFWAAPTK